MNAIIISIGDELLIGQVVNTNAAFISQKLQEIGIRVRRILVVGDSDVEILRSFAEAADEVDLVIATGGLGPTHDDITREAVCKFFKRDLVPDSAILDHIRSLMLRRNIRWNPAAEDQARIPKGSIPIPNIHGTAPGILIEHERGKFIAMPGVPHEMEAMVVDFLIPYLRTSYHGNVIMHRTLKTTGIPEAFLAVKIGKVEEFLNDARLAFLPSPIGTQLRITVESQNQDSAYSKIKEIEAVIRNRAGKYIYGADDDQLETVLGRMLSERKLTIAVAESCTGGLISNRLTNVSGSSSYLERGVVAYSNRSKSEILDVPSSLIESHGAVSREVAEAMAAGIRRRAQTDIGLSTTGIAGPTGATADKPIGLVWIGYADATEALALKFHFPDQRLRFKERASQAALELVRRKLLKMDLTEQHLI